MSIHALPCVKCDKPLKNVNDGSVNQPAGGTAFSTTGHYGSTIIDEMDGNFTFVVNLCDTCILRAIEAEVIMSHSPQIHLSPHRLTDREKAWVLAQNEKYYGSAWGEDQPVDYNALMLKAGWPKEQLEDEEQ